MEWSTPRGSTVRYSRRATASRVDAVIFDPRLDLDQAGFLTPPAHVFDSLRLIVLRGNHIQGAQNLDLLQLGVGVMQSWRVGDRSDGNNFGDRGPDFRNVMQRLFQFKGRRDGPGQ